MSPGRSGRPGASGSRRAGTGCSTTLAALAAELGGADYSVVRELPLSGIVSLVLLALAFFIWSKKLERRIEELAEWAWARHKGLAVPHNRKQIGAIRGSCTAADHGVALSVLWRGVFVPLLGIAIGIVRYWCCCRRTGSGEYSAIGRGWLRRRSYAFPNTRWKIVSTCLK